MKLEQGFKTIFAGLLSCLLALNIAYAQADYATTSEVFNAKRAYEQAKLSPDGKHLSLLNRVDGQATLLIFELDTMKPVAALSSDVQQDILRFWWANNERVVVNLSLRNGDPEFPLLTGELHALNVDNTRKFAVAGFAAGDSANYEFLDAYSPNDKEVRVIRSDIKNGRSVDLDLSRPVAYNLDIYKRYRQSTGTKVSSKRLENRQGSPYPSGGFVADNDGELRLAYYVDSEDNLKISRPDGKTGEWVEYDFSDSIAVEEQQKINPVIGFDAGNTGVYYLAKSQYGTVGLFHLQLETGQVKALYEHEQLDMRKQDLIHTSDRDVVGVNPVGTTTAQFFDKTHSEVGRLRGLSNAFKGKRVQVLNYSRGGEYALVDVISEGSESGLYLFDGSNNSISLLMPANS
ncbi:MAG: hypothetical protein ACI9W1_003212 [Candidatus Azotimanducaceae bacterium]|jgi:hypothetical protein